MKGRVLMNITDIRVREVQTDSKMKAVASITFDNSFVVHDIKIVEGQEGMFIAMPSRKLPRHCSPNQHFRAGGTATADSG